MATADPFLNRGHAVIHHRDVLAPGSKDKLVAKTAVLNDATLIAVDRDFREMTKRFGNPANDLRFEGLNLILISCNVALASKRVDHFMSYIEHEWRVCCQKAARVMCIEISTHYVRSFR